MRSTTPTVTRILALLLAIVTLAAFALVSCNGNSGDSTDNGGAGDSNDGGNENTSPAYDVITIAEALELCGEPGDITEERYYIRGIIDTVTNAQYGAMVVRDETGSIPVYGTYSADGEKTYTELDYQPVKGDEVLLHCILQNYNGTKEVKNARLIEYKNNQGNIDVSEYPSVSVLEAREAQKGASVKVDGVVARITYANGMKPSGFILVDETSSIYVYDGDAAQRVNIGNKVEVAGTKDFWILESEQSSAAKFGYKGCNQITDVTLVSNDNKTDNKFDTSWVSESTVKDILSTPVTEDITTEIFKVNALVAKTPGSGFVNYYFYDLDGETGTYTYTQCNGSDFSWLDQFDGKICTVYLTALNAKSTATGCLFRLLPVAVYDENFKFDLDGTAEHIVKYYGLDQFKSLYTGNPEAELLTKVSSELLGFTDAELSYTSSNTDAVFFTERDGALILECGESGKATVTVSGSYNGKTYSTEIEIEVVDIENIETVTVSEAIDAQLDEIVTLRGIVGPSLVNKNGFYLIDETGVIAVVVDEVSILGDIELGHEIIIEGKRDKFHDGKGTHAGQTCITGATVKANLYGSHEYDTSNFVTDKTLTDFYNLDVKEDYSTTVFVFKATVVLEGNQFYTNMKLSDGKNKISLYCSSANQYSFLKKFEGEEITVEIAACNWNNKSYYAGCVLSVITEDGKIFNTLNFDVN